MSVKHIISYVLFLPTFLLGLLLLVYCGGQLEAPVTQLENRGASGAQNQQELYTNPISTYQCPSVEPETEGRKNFHRSDIYATASEVCPGNYVWTRATYDNDANAGCRNDNWTWDELNPIQRLIQGTEYENVYSNSLDTFRFANSREEANEQIREFMEEKSREWCQEPCNCPDLVKNGKSYKTVCQGHTPISFNHTEEGMPTQDQRDVMVGELEWGPFYWESGGGISCSCYVCTLSSNVDR